MFPPCHLLWIFLSIFIEFYFKFWPMILCFQKFYIGIWKNIPIFHSLPSVIKNSLTSWQAKCHGIGARCSVLLKLLYPSNIVSEKFPMMGLQERLDNLIMVKEDKVNCQGWVTEIIFFTSITFPGESLFVTPTFMKVAKGGDPLQFFAPWSIPQPTQVFKAPTTEQGELSDDVVFSAINNQEDITLIQAMGCDINDDNASIPENIHNTNRPQLPTKVSIPGNRGDQMD